ncbi:MAG: tRNA (adenosine(37)-N6)-threonylcarbamoyltransferase complex dimerization subunit type 1 TsaB [Steroidobacteraceae bacterium]
MSRVLALDAATEACSVALLCNGDVLERCIEAGKHHAQQLLAMAQELMALGEVSWSMLDGIAASIGPGAFTGVRITVSVAQGLAFGAGLPVAAVTTLEALALQVLNADADRAIACLDARMGEVYWGCFAADAARGLIAAGAACVSPPEAVTLPAADAKAVRGVGRGFSAYPTLAARLGLQIDPESCRALPHAREIARLGALRLASGGGLDPADLQPLYLRDKVALTEAERRRPQA